MKGEIPNFLSHLEVFNGYPVPFVQMWIDGKPDFRVIDPEQSFKCIRLKLCAICGRKLGEFCYFIGGDACKENRLFLDAPMHEKCAEFASRTCPFVSGLKDEYSTRPLDESVRTVEVMSMTRPDKMFIFKSRTKKFKPVKVGDEVGIQAGSYSKITEI